MSLEFIKNSFCFIRVLCLLVSTLVLSSCDFSPRIHKKIILAQEYVIAQRYEDAVKEYNDILADNPLSDIKVKIHYQLGEIYSTNLAQNEKAITHFEKVQDYTDEALWIVKSHERMGEIQYSFIKDYLSSLRNYEFLFNFTPQLNNKDFYEFRMTMSYLKLGELEIAEKKLKEIYENPKHEYHVRSIYELGTLHFHKKEWKQAIDYWSQYIKKEKRRDNIVQTKFLMANAHETMENLQTAYNIYYSILGEYPNTEVVQNRLRSIYDRRVARKR